MRTSQNMDFFGKSIYIFLTILALFPLCLSFLYPVLFRMDLWLANLLEKGQV